MPSPERFAAVGFLYFAAASWCEVRQRLFRDAEDWPWEGFLGADDPGLSRTFCQALSHLEADPEGFVSHIARAIEPRNLVGLADPAHRNLYPLDERTLLAAGEKLGLTADRLQALLPRLRGAD